MEGVKSGIKDSSDVLAWAAGWLLAITAVGIGGADLWGEGGDLSVWNLLN